MLNSRPLESYIKKHKLLDTREIGLALSHKSSGGNNYERLEFLGDAVLDFIVAEWLYNHFPEKPEGDLTRLRAALVHTDQLAAFGRMIDLGRALRLGHGEIQAGGRKRVTLLCDAFEALVGALHLEGGVEAVNLLMVPLLEGVIDEIFTMHMDDDTKSRLQEWAQGNGFSSPKYILITEEGPDHAKTFTMEARINKEPYGRGMGSSKQAAEKMAAKEALISIGILERG